MTPFTPKLYIDEFVFWLNEGTCQTNTVDRLRALVKRAKRLAYKNVHAKKSPCDRFRFTNRDCQFYVKVAWSKDTGAFGHSPVWTVKMNP